jgi:hypothetical protein
MAWLIFSSAHAADCVALFCFVDGVVSYYDGMRWVRANGPQSRLVSRGHGTGGCYGRGFLSSLDFMSNILCLNDEPVMGMNKLGW